MIVVVVCCMIVFRVKPSGEVSRMQIKCGKSQDVNPGTDFRKEEKENSCDRRWVPAVHLSLWEDNKKKLLLKPARVSSPSLSATHRCGSPNKLPGSQVLGKNGYKLFLG